MGAAVVSFSVQAEKTDKDKQKEGRGRNKQKQGEEGRGEGEGGPDQARLFCEAGEMRWRYMKSCFYPCCCAPLVIKLTGFIHCDILAS